MLQEAVQKVSELYNSFKTELTWQSILVYGLILFVSWIVSKLYILPRLSPLRKMPGRPRGHMLLGNLPEIIRKEAIDPYEEWVKEMKTGIIRYNHVFGAYRVMIADADAVKHVLLTKAQNYVRPEFLFRIFTRVIGRSLLNLEGHEHKIQRHLCNTAFQLPNLKSLLPVFQKQAEQFSKLWKEKIQQQVSEGPTMLDIHSSLASLTFDIICEAGFGYESKSVNDPQASIFKAFSFLLGGSGNRLLRIVIPRLYPLLPTENNRQFSKSLTMMHSLIQGVIGKKRDSLSKDGNTSGKPQRPDLLENLLLATDVETGSSLSEQQLRDLVMTFMLAGHETTATALCWTLLALARYPDVQVKARQEVMSVLPPLGQPVTFEHLENLTYLTCVVKESLRLFPPVPMVVRETVQDDVICGYEIPKGTVINISIGALHRNPEYWDSPEKFMPERFEDESKIPTFAFQPFISGPHLCIGYRFALLELKLLLANLLQQFEFSLLPDVTYKKKMVITMRPSPELKLFVRCIG